MASKFTYSEDTVRQIETLVPRLKYSVYPTKIIKWLENFEEEDIPSAIDILRVFEYIPFNEFMSRLNDLLKELLKEVKSGEKVIVFPYGKIGKSGTLVTYPLRNTEAFKKRKNEIIISHDLKYINNAGQYKHIIFLDDFIGSGNTFCKEFETTGIRDWLIEHNISSVFILSAIIMKEGKLKIQEKYPSLKIISEVRYKLFDKTYSPINAFGKKTYNKVEQFALKYGNKISVNRPPNQYQPRGYDNSESNISFFHGTPNNTLPIIWGQNKDWQSLYARDPKTRMTEAKKLKKELEYYISISDKLKINLFKGTILINQQPDIRTHKIKSLRKQDHAALILLFLIKKGYENIFICQILAITREELRYIYHELRNKKLVTADYKSITPDGYNLLNKLAKQTKKEKIRNESNNNLTIKKSLYLPKSFEGMT